MVPKFLRRVIAQFFEPGSDWRRRGLFGAASLVVILAAVSDCFGLQSRTDQLSIDVGNRLLAPFHPRAGQDQVTVVLLDDTFLRQGDRGWPLTYADHAEILDRIGSYRPRALFVDFLFLYRHSGDPSLSQLADTLAYLRDEGVPVFVGAPNPCLAPTADLAASTAERRPGLALLGEVAAVAEPVIVEWEGVEQLYPVAFHPTEIGATRDDARACARADSTVVWPSAALALFEATCRSESPGATCGDWARSAPSPPPPMLVHWGAGVSELAGSARDVDGACPYLKFGWGRRLRWAVSALWADLMRGFVDDGGLYLECPYTDTLMLSDVFLRHPRTGHDWRPPEREVELRALLRDRVVLLGSGLPQSGDYVTSPVHGQIPGVFVHAMALDNLLVWGTGYYRQSLGTWSIEVLLEVGLSLGLLWVLIRRRMEVEALLAEDQTRVETSWRQVLRWTGSYAGYGIGFSVLTLGVVMLLSVFLNRSPINWIGLFSLLGGALPLSLGAGPLVEALKERTRGRDDPPAEPSEQTDAGPRHAATLLLLLAAGAVAVPAHASADDLRIVEYRAKKVGTQTQAGKFSGRVPQEQLPRPPVPVTGMNQRGALRIEVASGDGVRELYLDRFDVEIAPKARTNEEVCAHLRRQARARPPDRSTRGSMQLGPGCAAEE